MVKLQPLIQWGIQAFPEGVLTLHGAPKYNYVKFSQKLHEIERIWTPRGACVQNPPLLLSPTKCVVARGCHIGG